MKKLYVVRKYVLAESAAQAIRLEHKSEVHDVFLDEEWSKVAKAQPPEELRTIGF